MKYNYAKIADEVFIPWSERLHQGRYLVNYHLDNLLTEALGKTFTKNRPKIRGKIINLLQATGKIKELCPALFILWNR